MNKTEYVDDPPVATGQFYTHAACPHCDYENEYADDVRGDEVTCIECDAVFKVV